MSSSPLTTILKGEEDLDTVYEKVFPARTVWNNIGLGLRLSPDTLGAIEVECHGKSDNALRKMLKIWFDTKKPTWEKLCNCLRKTTVSRNVLADEIQDYVQGVVFSFTYCLIMIINNYVCRCTKAISKANKKQGEKKE